MQESARRRYLIVDGHSVIHAWHDLRARHKVNPRSAREELLARLTEVHDACGASLVVVFDGTGPRKATSERRSPVDVQIVYSGRGETADAVIERLVAAYASTHDLTVATNDGAERLAVTGSGAWWISADTLQEQWQATVQARNRELGRLKGRGGGVQLRDLWDRPSGSSGGG